MVDLAPRGRPIKWPFASMTVGQIYAVRTKSKRKGYHIARAAYQVGKRKGKTFTAQLKRIDGPLYVEITRVA